MFKRDQHKPYDHAEIAELAERIRKLDPGFDAIELFSGRYTNPDTGEFDVRALECRARPR